ncbi:MAG TPA: hypothetical protein PLQ36_02855 [Candidatus Gracilibacteria bacterium]|nr:hypothetical protein [Candidatus Gracilibacteria bacterium]
MHFGLKRKGAVLLEGLIILTIINIMVVAIFSYLKLVNTHHTRQVHQERANLLMMSMFEEIRALRDSEIKSNYQQGWQNFLAHFNPNDLQRPPLSEGEKYHIKALDNGELVINPNNSILDFPIAPYAEYEQYFNIRFSQKEDQTPHPDIVIINGVIRWSAEELDQIQQEIRLTNHYLYENQY